MTRLGRDLPLLRLAHRSAVIALIAVLALPSDASASLLSPELEDKLANILALVVLFIVPVVLIVLFWLVHILPEKIAHNRQHPQFEAIRTLCLLSLVFGGLLWPLAWIWAYSKPVFHKMAYGTDEVPHSEEASAHDVESSLQTRIARLEGHVPPADLDVLRADLAALEARFPEQGVR